MQGREAAPLGNTVMTQLHALSSPFTALPLPALARTGAVAVDELQFAADSLLVSGNAEELVYDKLQHLYWPILLGKMPAPAAVFINQDAQPG